MAKKKTVSDLSKSGQVNSFTGGINTDLHPMLQPNDTLTDCLNGTLITYNGNENMLQNDMGNYELKNAKLPEGYIPMGIKEHQGVLYMILMNPITNKVQIGSYPSPQTIFEKNSNSEEYLISPVKIGKLEMVEQFSGLDDGQTKSSSEAAAVWNVIDGDDALQSECLFSKLDLSKSSTVFTKDFHQNSFLNFGDKYLLNADSDNGEDPVFQTLEYFSIDKEKNITTIDENIVKDDSKTIDLVDNTDSSKFDDVLWNTNGWLGARYKVQETEEISQQVSGSLQGVSDRLSITEYRKISDVTDCVINQKPFTYEFVIEGANFQNMIVDFEGFLKNNTDTAFITTNKHLYDDRLVEKKEWSGGCYLEGDYDLPLYKFENEHSYIGIIPEFDDSYDSNDWSDIVENNKEQAKSWFVQNFVEESFGSSRINGIVFPSIGDVKFKKVLDRLHNIKNASLYFTQTPFKALWETILETFGSSNCTFYFSKICNSEFIQYLHDKVTKEPDKYNAKLPQEFVEYTWKSDPENVSTHITFDELHSYNSKKIRYYYDVDVEKWGLNGTYSPGKTAIYKFADTDWKSAIRGITKYATEVIYPNDSDLTVVDYPTCNTVAYNISNLVRCKFIHKEQIEGVDKTLVPEVNSTIFGNVDKTFSVEINTDKGVGLDFLNIMASLELGWVGISQDDPDNKPPKDLLGRLPVFNIIEHPGVGGEDKPDEDGWFKISPKILKYGEINPLFLYQFSCINFQLKGNSDKNGLEKYVKNIRLTNESKKLKLLLDVDTRYYDDKFTKNITNRDVLYYLAKDFMFSAEFRVWKIFNGELTTYSKYYSIPIKILPSIVDSKFIVPELFDGLIGGMSVGIKQNEENEENLEIGMWSDNANLTKWSDDFKQVLYTVPKKEKIVDGILNILVQCQDDVKIATKISYDDETKYINVDKLGATFKFKTLGNSMSTITISSVPYRIDQDQNCLIYDNLVITDQINYFENCESKIEKFQYYKDGNKIKILLESSSSLQYQECYDSIDVCVYDNGMLRSIPFTIPEKPEELNTYGNVLNFSLKVDTTEDFVFLLMNLDEDDSINVPIYTKLTEEKHDSLISKKILDFTQAYADDLISKNIEIDESFIENNNSGEMYVTAEKLDDKLKIIHSSQNEYYWYNGIGDFNSQSDGNKNRQIYFGKAEQLDSKINLTKLGINEGDIISIDGIPDKEYSTLTVAASNYELFEKTEEGLFLKLKVTRGYNMTSYSIENSASPIAMRKYLFHHGYHPITHSDIDFDWDKHPQIFEHFGWDSYKPNSFKMLYVAKANAYNSNVHLGVINDAGEGYDEKSESFTKGNVVTNKNQAENKIYQVVGKDSTSQLFTLIKATIDVDGSGLTIPLPKMRMLKENGLYKYKCNKNKENKGTDQSIVLTRDSNGLEWKNKLKNAFAYASIGAGVAALATVIVMGCIAAANAAAGAIAGLATIAAASAAIPFVGWAVLAAAVIAASVWLLCKVTAGVDQEFEFFAMRGPAKQPLVIPLWGSHRGYTNAKGKIKDYWYFPTFTDEKHLHPWYLDVDFAHAEELITYIMTHVYYYMPGPSVLLGSAGNSTTAKSTPITITLHSISESSLGLDKYKILENSITKTNNFTVLEGNVPATFTYPNSKDVEIENNFIVTNQKVSYINTVDREGIYYDTCENAEINKEIYTFTKNLHLSISGDNVDLYYKGDTWTSEQNAFGGNTGGRSAKLKCFTTSFKYKRMMSGEFPKNNLAYIPLAYAVNPDSDDPIMIKDYGLGNSNSYWGESERTYPSPTDGSPKKGSKYFDHIHWDTYSNEFKLTTNTNEI